MYLRSQCAHKAMSTKFATCIYDARRALYTTSDFQAARNTLPRNAAMFTPPSHNTPRMARGLRARKLKCRRSQPRHNSFLFSFVRMPERGSVEERRRRRSPDCTMCHEHPSERALATIAPDLCTRATGRMEHTESDH